MKLDFDEIVEVMGASRFDGFVKGELSKVCWPEQKSMVASVFVCGRYGAGKSTFADNWLGHQEYFPTSYHIDSDRIMADLYNDGVIDNRANELEFQAVQARILEALSYSDLSFTYSFAGKKTLGPLNYRLPKTLPGYEDLFGNEKIIPKPVGHMVLCDTEVALSRVRHRQANGGHPYQKLEGDFEREYIEKQAEIIYGLPLYADGTDDYYVWDLSESGYQRLIAHISMDNNGHRTFTIHDSEAAAKFGLTEENIRTIFNLYDHYEVGYQTLLGGVIGRNFDTETKETFDENVDSLNGELIKNMLSQDEFMVSIHASAMEDLGGITFQTAPEIRIGAMEKYRGPMSTPCRSIERRME